MPNWSRRRILITAIGICLPTLIAAAIYQRSHLETIPNPKMPNPNARDTWIAARKALQRRPSDLLRGQIYTEQGPYTVTADDRAAAVAQNQASLRLVRQGLAQSYLNIPMRSFDHLMPEFAGFRELARLLALESRTFADQGQWARAAGSGLDAIEMGNKIPKGGVLIAKLVGCACEGIGRRSLVTTIHRLNAAEARAALSRISALDATRMPYAETLQEESWAQISGLKNTFSQPEYSPMEIIKNLQKNPPRQWQDYQAAARLIFDRGGIIRENQTLWHERIAYARQPFATRGPLPRLSGSANNPGMLGSLPMPSNSFVPIFPVLEQGWVKDLDGQMQNRLLIVRFALRAYRLEIGAYPATLDDLVKNGDLSTLPADPFTASGTFRYRRLTADRYLLYSIGPDGKDDGGNPVKDRAYDRRVAQSVSQDSKGDFVAGINDTQPANAAAP